MWKPPLSYRVIDINNYQYKIMHHIKAADKMQSASWLKFFFLQPQTCWESNPCYMWHNIIVSLIGRNSCPECISHSSEIACQNSHQVLEVVNIFLSGKHLITPRRVRIQPLNVQEKEYQSFNIWYFRTFFMFRKIWPIRVTAQ